MAEGRDPGWSTFRVDYILRTGALWRGPIDEADIRIYPGKYFQIGPRVECYPPWQAISTWDFVVIGPAGYSIKKEPETCIVWKLKDFVPKNDIQVIFSTTLLDELLKPLLFDDSSRQTLEKAGNDLLALHGKVFESDTLKQHYEQMKWDGNTLSVVTLSVPNEATADLVYPQKSIIKKDIQYILNHWYSPNPSFTESALTPCEQEFLDEITKRVSALRSATVPANRQPTQ